MTRSYVTIDVDVYLDEFDDDALIEELEDRGYTVVDKNESFDVSDLTSDEIAAIVGAFQHCKPGTIGNDIYEKLRKR